MNKFRYSIFDVANVVLLVTSPTNDGTVLVLELLVASSSTTVIRNDIVLFGVAVK